MKAQKARRFRGRNVLLTAAVILLMLVVVAASTAVYAYFSTRIYVYTSDGNREVAKLGMRLNLLFDRINPEEVAEDTPLSIVMTRDAEGVETYYTYDSEAEWGSPQNPYIISDVRHLHNLSALQSIGYFADMYIKYNYEDEDMSGTYLETAVMPYFLVCEPDGTPATVDCEDFTITPIGTDEYPFIGYVGGAFVEGTTTVDGYVSDTSAIYNLNVTADEDRSDVGLFGSIGYLGTEPDEESGDTTFVGAVSIVRNLLLYDVRVQVTDHSWVEKLAHRFSHDPEDDSVSHENHHIGILAGHVEYATLEYISVYYSSDDIAAIDLSHVTNGSTSSTVPNYLSSSGILGFIYNMNPNLVIDENGNYSITASSGKSSEYVQAIGSGNDWGGSVDMQKMYNNLTTVYSSGDAHVVQYPSAKTVTIDSEGNETETVTAYSNVTVTLNGNNRTLTGIAWDEDATASYVFGTRDTGDGFRYLYGQKDFALTQTVTTITYTNEEATVISDGAGHYLNLSNGNIAVGDSAETATRWRFGDGATKTIYTQAGDNIYYLRSNNNALSAYTGNQTGTSYRTPWTVSNNKISYNNYYLTYNNGAWTLSNVTTYYLIHDNHGHYLNAAANAFSTGTVESEATKWTFSAPNGSGTISTKIGGTTYYLRNYNNGTLQVSTTSTNWTSNSTAVYNGNYYLSIDNESYTWGLYDNSVTGYIIGDGNGNYLSLSNGTLTNVTSAASATAWGIANTGVIYARSGNYNYYYYLRSNNNALAIYNSNSTTLNTTGNTNRTAWTVDMENGTISYNGYYLVYDSGWKLSDASSYYLIHDGNGHYLNGTTGSLSVGTSADSATKWTQNNNSYLSPLSNPTYYLCWYYRNNTSRPLYLYTSGTRIRSYYTYTDGYLKTTYQTTTYYARFNNNAWTYTTDQAQATAITMQEITVDTTLTLVDKSTLVNRTVYHTQHNYDYTLTLDDATFTDWKTTATSTENITYTTDPTAYPLAIDENGAVMHNKNTGYVVGGVDYTYSGSGSTYPGDIRVSQYAMSNISVALGGNTTYNPARLEIITRTASSNGYALIQDESGYNNANSVASGYDNIPSATRSNRRIPSDLGLKKYASARDQLEDLFNPENANGVRVASTNIYGLHFMNLTANTSIGDNTHRITVPTAWINGTRYTNYVMPTNCIDFNLKQRGSINFFAGSYFISGNQSNDTFFALYKVVRGNDGSLQSVIEIEKIYGNASNDLAPVYYKLSGQSRYTTDGVNFLTDEQWAALPAASKTLLFDMDWVTMSNGNTIVNNAVYYFEIPVNEGEFALGCVTGNKTGAYLMYLDIGASETAISYRDGAAGSALGTIDFVYSNESEGTVVTVSTLADELPENEDYRYYYASLCLVMTDNDYRDSQSDPFPNINQCKLYIRREIGTVDDITKPIFYIDVECSNEKYIRTVSYSALADPIARTNSAYSP